jgi:hypothetical protein
MSNSLDLKFDLPTDAELDSMFNMVPQLEKYNVQDKVIRAGVAPVVAKARQLAPRSNEKSRNKRSRKQQAEADWNYPLWKSIKYVIRKYQKHGIGVIGPEWPKGNKAYFNTSPKGRKRILWGKLPDPESPKPLSSIAPQIRNWIVEAFDTTKAQQLSAMKVKLEELLEQIFKKNG